MQIFGGPISVCLWHSGGSTGGLIAYEEVLDLMLKTKVSAYKHTMGEAFQYVCGNRLKCREVSLHM